MDENRNDLPTQTEFSPEHIPHVPPSETTVSAPAVQTAPKPCYNNYCKVSEPNFSNRIIGPAEQVPLPREKADRNHNAFRDEPSAMSEAVRKKHYLLKGTAPLEGEPPHIYHGRMAHEANLLHEENKSGLKSSVTKISLLLALYTVIQFTVTLTVPSIAQYFGWLDSGIPLQKTLLLIIIYALIYPAAFPIVIYLGNIGETHKTRTFLRKPKCTPAYVFKWFVIVIGCTYITSIVFDIITQAVGYDSGMTAEPFTSLLDAVSQLVILCVFAPIFEELLFRGVMLSHHLKYGAWHACIISALYFGLFHANLPQLPYTFVGGLFLAMVTLKTGSVIPSIIIHALLNFTSYLQLVSLSLIDNYDAYMNGVDMLPKGSPFALVLYAFTTLLPWILMIAAVIMLIVELVKNKATFRMPQGDSGLTAKEKANAYFTAPAAWVAITVGILAIIFQEILKYLSTHAS